MVQLTFLPTTSAATPLVSVAIAGSDSHIDCSSGGGSNDSDRGDTTAAAAARVFINEREISPAALSWLPSFGLVSPTTDVPPHILAGKGHNYWLDASDDVTIYRVSPLL